MDFSYLYTTLLAFHLVIDFDKRREIKIKDLIYFRQDFFEKCLDNDLIEIDENFFTNDEDSLLEFVNEYPDSFYVNNDTIIINDKISLEDIYKELKEIYDEHAMLYSLALDKNLFYILKIYNIYRQKEKIENIAECLEKNIEKEYLDENVEQIKKSLLKRYVFIQNVKSNYKDLVRNYSNIPEDDDVIVDEEYDFYNNSIYVENDECYPLNLNVYYNSQYYKEDDEKNINTIPEVIENPFNYAIFGKDSLYQDKYFEYFNNLYMYENFKNTDSQTNMNIEDIIYQEYDLSDESTNYCEMNLDFSNIEFDFYLVYIVRLLEMYNIHSYSYLLRIKARLLYLLDDIDYCLFDNNNLNKIYSQILNKNYDEDDFEYFEDLAKYFILELFEGDDQLQYLEKLVFVNTYYILTKDKEIIELLNKYKKNSRYDEYYYYITGDSKGKTLEMIRNN